MWRGSSSRWAGRPVFRPGPFPAFLFKQKTAYEIAETIRNRQGEGCRAEARRAKADCSRIPEHPKTIKRGSRKMDAPQGYDQNADQVAYWNGPAGQRWAARQAEQDVVLGPVADLVIDRA